MLWYTKYCNIDITVEYFDDKHDFFKYAWEFFNVPTVFYSHFEWKQILK